MVNHQEPSMTPTLLRIDSSARTAGSVSRQLADAAESAWLAGHPGGAVQRRDLARQPVAHIAEATIEGFYTPDDALDARLRAATALSDELVAELAAAHTLLIAAPVYNFSVPSSLKAWIDQIVRIRRTFAYEDGQFRGLVRGPRAVLALAYGADGYSGPLAQLDHLRPYLTSLLHFLGIEDVRVVAAEATTGPDAPARIEAALMQAKGLWAERGETVAA
jgi:FMN-dependent NADH-azoreductase